MEDDIEKIRKDAITEIKEKVKKSPGYLHPCNKERQEDRKRLKFVSGYEFTYWMQQNGIMKNPTDINRRDWEIVLKNAKCETTTEYRDRCAQRTGFKNGAEKLKEWRHKSGRQLPKEFNEDCSSWFGEFISQNYVMETFEDPVPMPPNNPGFDWICKKGQKIDHKGACLSYSNKSNWNGWNFPIRWNNIADYFILSAWDNRDSLTPLHVWIFHKNDIVRGRKFWEREGFTITNTPDKLKELEKFEVTDRLDKLKELCNRHRNENKISNDT